MARRAAAWTSASNDADGSTSHGSGLRPSTLATIAPTRSGGGGSDGDGGSNGDGGSSGSSDDGGGASGEEGGSESASVSSSATDVALPPPPPILKPQANQNCCAYSSINLQRA